MAAIAIGSAAVGVLLYAGGMFATLNLRSIDTRFALRGTQSLSRFEFIGEDTSSLNQINSYPFPRRDDAAIVYFLKSAHARAIGVDLQFTTQTDPTDDNDIAAAATGVVLATTEYGTGRYIGQNNVFGGYATADGAKVGLGLFPIDSDGAIRSFPYEEHDILSFSVLLAEQATGRRVPASEFPGGSAPIDFAGPAGTVPEVPFVDVLCSVPKPLVNSLAPKLVTVVDGRVTKVCVNQTTHQPIPTVNPAIFKGRIVIVGSDDPVFQDQHATATAPLMYGAELNANAINTILKGNPLSYVPGWATVILTIAFGLVVPLLRLRFGMSLTIAFAVALAVVYSVVVQLAFDGGLIFSYVYPLFALAIGTVVSNAADFVLERGHRETLETELARLPGESSDFFISYRREQSSWPAGILRSALVTRFGESSVFMDLDSISAGETWPMRIEEAIRSSNVMLVLIGPDWADARVADGTRRLADPGDWVRREVETGLATPRCAVVPVLLDGATIPPPEALPQSLAELTHRNAFALSAANWDAELTQLLDSVQHGRIREFLTRERAGAGSEQAPTQA